MKKPAIGVTPLYDKKKNSVWMLPGYMRGIEEAGGLPVILSLTADENAIVTWADELDGFLFTGGQDVDPALYGEKRLPECGEICPEKDRMENLLLRYALHLDKAVFGICRGLQFINAYLGGTLYQDIPSQKEGALAHSQPPPYDAPSHEVKMFKESPLFRWLNKDKTEVNSLHHQGIRQLARGLRTAAVAPDGLVEAAWMPDKKFVFGVQWHPEYNHETSEDSQKLFFIFISAAANK